MHDQIAVRVIHCFANLKKDVQPGVRCESSFLAIAVDGLAVDILGDQERIAVRGDPSLEAAGLCCGDSTRLEPDAQPRNGEKISGRPGSRPLPSTRPFSGTDRRLSPPDIRSSFLPVLQTDRPVRAKQSRGRRRHPHGVARARHWRPRLQEGRNFLKQSAIACALGRQPFTASELRWHGERLVKQEIGFIGIRHNYLTIQRKPVLSRLIAERKKNK